MKSNLDRRSGRAGDGGLQPTASGPYEDERQARADVADVYGRRGIQSVVRYLAKRNRARLARRVRARWCDSRRVRRTDMAWLASWEPQICAAIISLITRASQRTGRRRHRAAARPVLLGRAAADFRFCQCPDCQHRSPRGRPPDPDHDRCRRGHRGRGGAVISYRHAYELVSTHGETGLTARLVPFTVDGLILAASMLILDANRRHQPVPPLARWCLGAGIVATIGANLAHGLGHGP